MLLAYAQRTDLDHLAANVRLKRLVIQEADTQSVPPVPQVMELDDALRERIQLVYEGLTTAGPRNSYILHARNASALVADAQAESPSPAHVVVNSTQLERGIEQAIDDAPTIHIRTLYNARTCPAHLLHQLAWAWSVDRWDNTWSEQVKRAAIDSAFYIHAHKGTIGALRRVVEPLGYLLEVIEWWQTVPLGEPGTFALKVGVLETGITEDMYRELTALIDDAKPLSRTLTELVISLESTGNLNIYSCLYEGEVIDVYPPAPRDIEVTGHFGPVGREHQIETLDVYP